MVSAAEAWATVAAVPDPEIPVLTIEDLGILREVSVEDGCVVVTITPTYLGCPALDVIAEEIASRLHDRGMGRVQVRTVLSPAWTTDWMSEDGRRKLRDYGISPPGQTLLQLGVRCPHCGSVDSHERSRFGATACQAQYVCRACLEPFDYFKDH